MCGVCTVPDGSNVLLGNSWNVLSSFMVVCGSFATSQCVVYQICVCNVLCGVSILLYCECTVDCFAYLLYASLSIGI
jgi:hypothetical protein